MLGAKEVVLVGLLVYLVLVAAYFFVDRLPIFTFRLRRRRHRRRMARFESINPARFRKGAHDDNE